MTQTNELSEYEKIALDIADIVKNRQETYGDSFGNSGNILRILYPNGISINQYDDLMAITRMLDKIFRIATGHLEDSYTDIVGYGLLGAVRSQKI